MKGKPVNRLPEHQTSTADATVFDLDDQIELHAFGQTISVFAPKIDFLRADSLWRLRHIYQRALSTQSLAKEGVALDIGAGFGVFAVPFALACPGWQIFCFEPDPTAFSYLQKNIDDLALSQIIALPFAVGHTKEDAPSDAKAVCAALKRLQYDTEAKLDRLTALLPLRNHSKSLIHNGYLERGHNTSAEFSFVKVPTLAAGMLEVLSPTLLKIIAPKAEVEILTDLSQSKIDHVIGESWRHIPTSILQAPSAGLRQTWIPRAGQSQFGLRRSLDISGQSLHLDVIVAIPSDGDVNFSWIADLLSDPSMEIRVLVVGDEATEPAKLALQTCSRSDPRVRFFHRPNAGQGSSWNFGRLQSSATHIAFVDAQSRPGQSFFQGLLELARQTGAEVVQGPFYGLEGEDPFQIPFGVTPQETHAALKPRFEIADTTYHRMGNFALISEPPTIWRRVYRRDFLDNRRIWFPEHLASMGEFVFQTLTLSAIPDVPTLDGVIFGHAPSKPAGQDMACCIIESFRILLNRAGGEGWNELSPLFQTFAFQLNNSVAHLDAQDQPAFLKSAAELWAYAHKLFGPDAFEQAPLDMFGSVTFSEHFAQVFGKLGPLSTSQAWEFLSQGSHCD